MAGYAGGRIKRIKIRNFMTYDNVELHPKKGLNLIIGLNGSGKSSIMCAICLGLAGRPHFTGRATQLSDFIKHGCEEAEIEIELEKAKGSLCIRRKIKGDKCEWLLNHGVSNHNEVANAVKRFNIDTSNLCQFLPQEKVVEFSRMDKKQRLENMLQAIGEPHLFELFNDLKYLNQSCDEIDNDLKRNKLKKKSAEEENERISDEVQKQESRVRLKKELDELFNKRKILNYEDIRAEVQNLKKRVNDLERELSATREEQNQANNLEKSILDSYSQYSQQQQQFSNQKKDVTNEIIRRSDFLKSLKEEVENANIEYKNRLTEVENQKKRLYDLKKQIEGMKTIMIEEMKKCEKYEEKEILNSQNLSKLQQEINAVYEKMERISAERVKNDNSVQNLQKQLSSLQNEHNKKMDNLKRLDKFTYQAALWLIENRHTFKSNVYLPIMLEIKVHSSETCKYVENAIPFRDMIAFVCEDKSDYERFTDILARKELPANVVMPPDKPLREFASSPLESEYKKCGLQCYVSELFTAPEPIMRYLCSCYGIHRIPVATTSVSGDSLSFILTKYKTFFSGNFRFTGKVSRYGNRNMSQKKDYVMESNFLSIHNDEPQSNVQNQLQTLQTQKQSITKEMEELQVEFEKLEKTQKNLRQEKKSLEDQKKNITRYQVTYQQKLKFLNQISVINVDEEKKKVANKISVCNRERGKALGELNQLFKEFIHLEYEIVKVVLCMNSLSKSLKLTKAANEEVHDKVESIKSNLENMSKEYRDKKRSGQGLLQELKAMGDFNLLGLTAEDIEQKINHIQAQLNVDEDNERLVADYNARKQKIEEYQAQIDSFYCRIEEIKGDIQEKKTQWLTRLQRHIGNINKKFSSYFKQLNCAGEISLEIPDNPDNFAKYGLQIRLKFRDEEPLTELSQTRHSGGECSVAAIVFILSLQELTEVPFRCIDEINQGMDSVNERKIYQLIADSVEDDKCSQYFLLTPKLLPDLQYPDDVAVHVIFNSCFLNIKLDVKRHLEIVQSV